jgi:hypothetical protein
MTLTDQDVVRLCAERLGCKVVDETKLGDGTMKALWWENPHGRPVTHQQMGLFLTSHDALRPVLAKLTVEEWMRAEEIISRIKKQPVWARTTLTLEPRALAYAVAEVLSETHLLTPI